MHTIQCARCRQHLPPQSFYLLRRKHTWGPGHYHRYDSYCKTCRLAYTRNWKRKRRDAFNHFLKHPTDTP